MILWGRILSKICLPCTKDQSQKHTSRCSLSFLTPFSMSPIHTRTSVCTFLRLRRSFLDAPYLVTVPLLVSLAPSLIFHLLLWYIPKLSSECLLYKVSTPVPPQLKTIRISATDPASYDTVGTLVHIFLSNTRKWPHRTPQILSSPLSEMLAKFPKIEAIDQVTVTRYVILPTILSPSSGFKFFDYTPHKEVLAYVADCIFQWWP